MGSKTLRGLFVAALAVTGLSLRALPVSAATPSVSPPGQYYLSLGDSLAYGYQQFKASAEMAAGNVDPTTFNTGYTDDFYRMLQAIDPGIQLVNYGCPGQTTSGFISSSGCQFPLHNGYTTSQLQAAVAFLTALPGQVNPITIDIGANDILHLVSTCHGLNLACVGPALPAALQTMGANLAQILPALRQAAPNAQIMLVGLYNPFAAVDPTTDVLGLGVNKVLSQVAAASGVTFVNTFSVVNPSASEKQTVCALTLFCTALRDIHPTDAGYLAIAKLLWDSSGFARYAHGFMVAFTSVTPGNGEVLFGSGPGCNGLVEVATRDLQPPGGMTHIVYVTGNDLPGTVGDAGILPGNPYSYATVTVSSSGTQTDTNGGACYTADQPAA